MSFNFIRKIINYLSFTALLILSIMKTPESPIKPRPIKAVCRSKASLQAKYKPAKNKKYFICFDFKQLPRFCRGAVIIQFAFLTILETNSQAWNNARAWHWIQFSRLFGLSFRDPSERVNLFSSDGVQSLSAISLS